VSYSSPQIFSVRPKPCAAFSALTIATSTARSRLSPGRCVLIASRPERPTTSPQRRIFKKEAARVGDCLSWRSMERSRLGRRPLQLLRGPASQVGAVYRSHDSDRDSSQEVDIGPGV